jgi:hypothetical protein
MTKVHIFVMFVNMCMQTNVTHYTCGDVLVISVCVQNQTPRSELGLWNSELEITPK